MRRTLLAWICIVAAVTATTAQDAGTPDERNLKAAATKRPYSPWTKGSVPNRVFWGDTHLHTSFSVDAGAFGARLDEWTSQVPPGQNLHRIANATWTNTIGATELIAVWKDPDFDPVQRAFYYVRVLEIPTPRWTAYDAKYFGLDVPDEIPMITQERAYTSPIWYTP